VNVYFGIILVYFHLKIETSSKYFLWNHRSGTFHRELKWNNQLIFNIQYMITYFIKFDNCFNDFWNTFTPFIIFL
jgi:hypothetical protein